MNIACITSMHNFHPRERRSREVGVRHPKFDRKAPGTSAADENECRAAVVVVLHAENAIKRYVLATALWAA